MVYRSYAVRLGEVIIGYTRGGYARRRYDARLVKAFKRERDAARAEREARQHG